MKHGLFLLCNVDPSSSVSEREDGDASRDNLVQVWDLVRKRHLRSYSGFSQSKYILRPCFAGEEESMVVSGSEGTLQCRTRTAPSIYLFR
jgi:hypothetical protein